jgi:hypothetical protein
MMRESERGPIAPNSGGTGEAEAEAASASPRIGGRGAIRCLSAHSLGIVALLLVTLSLARSASAQPGGRPMPLTVHNTILRASYDEAAGTFALTNLATGHPFAVNGTLAGVTGPARTEAVTDRVFGSGQAIVVTSAQGGVGRIMVFPHLPFALLRLTLKNSGPQAETLNSVPVAGLQVGLGQPASALKTLGTGGLSAPQGNPGSYA